MDVRSTVTIRCFIFLTLGFPLVFFRGRSNSFVFGEDHVVINEINSDTPEFEEEKEFIELKAICPEDKELSLDEFKLIIIEGRSVPEIILIAELWSQKIKCNSFFTIGHPSIVPSLPTTSGNVQYRKKVTQSRGGQTMLAFVKNFIKNPNKFPNAIILLKGHSVLVKKELLTRWNPTIKMNSNIARFIKAKMIDMVVYGRRAPTDRCSFFEDLQPAFKDKLYLLREMDNIWHSDYSLNRCCESSEAYLPEVFKLGRPTPNTENDCGGFHFILEKILKHTNYEPTPSTSATDSAISTVNECESTCVAQQTYISDMNSKEVGDYITEEMKKARSASSVCPTTIDLSGGAKSIVIQDEDSRLKNIIGVGESDKITFPSLCAKRKGDVRGPDGDGSVTVPEKKGRIEKECSSSKENIPREWETTEYFKEDWLKKMDQYQNDLLSSAWFDKGRHKERRVWFEYLFNSENPKNSKMRCRLCRKYHEEFSLDKKSRPAMSREEGVIYSKKQKNWDAIAEHQKHAAHIAIIQRLQEKVEKKIAHEFVVAQEMSVEKTNALCEITSKMIRTVYAEVLTYTSANSHTVLVELQKLNGLNLGIHHYDKNAANRMTELISSEFHQILLKHMTRKEPAPFSIMLDASTDSLGNHYMMVYFKLLENSLPRVVFYKLISIEFKEDASSLLTTLQSSFNEDMAFKFADHLKTHLVGFGSDGASVMLGKQNGLIKKFNEYLGYKLFGVHCMAHRLDLAIKNAIKKNPYLSEHFENIVNGIYNYYSKSHKRKGHLRKVASEMKEKFYELTYIYQVRWSSSEYSAIRNLKRMWKSIIADLRSVSADSTSKDAGTTKWADDTKNKAKGFLKKLQGKYFMLVLHFMLDIFEVFRTYSQRFQGSMGVLSLQEKNRNGFISAVTNLKNKNAMGKNLATFLTSSDVTSKTDSSEEERSEDETLSTESIEEKMKGFGMATNKVMFGNIELNDDISFRGTHGENIYTRFEAFQKEFINSVLQEIESYFPEGDLKVFEIFLPSNLPTSVDSILTYGTQEIAVIARRFKVDIEKATDQWKELLEQIITCSSYCQVINSNIVDFWTYFLRYEGIQWKEEIKKVIHIILILPIGSADVERGFSIMNLIKSKRRMRMTAKTLENLLRIKINGPSDLSKFPALKYAKKWKASGRQLTDDPQHDTKSKSKCHFTDDNDDDKDKEDELESSKKSYFAESTLF